MRSVLYIIKPYPKAQHIGFWIGLIVVALGCQSSKQSNQLLATDLTAPIIQQRTYQDVTLRYAEYSQPEQPVLIFLHGAPGAWVDYKAYLEDSALLADFHMISVDRPGYGGSTSRQSFSLLTDQSRVLGQLLNDYADRLVVLIGHSYGGPVAIRVAMDYPNSVDALLLLAPAMDPLLEERMSWRRLLRHAWIAPWVPRGLFVANEEIIELRDELQAMEGGYRALSLPVYYIHGSYDALVPVANAVYAQRVLGHCDVSVHILEGVNHFIPWTHREKVKEGIYYLGQALQNQAD